MIIYNSLCKLISVVSNYFKIMLDVRKGNKNNLMRIKCHNNKQKIYFNFFYHLLGFV